MADHPTPSRLESFSDGVIAVIITIMVLEFKVPAPDGIAGLRTILPTLAVYLLSFAFTAIYWVNHHHLVHRLKRVEPLILYANLTFLFCLSLLPFFTSYLLQKHISSFSAEVYCGSLLTAGLGFTFLSATIQHHLRMSGELENQEETAQVSAEMRKVALSMALNALAIVMARWHPVLALVMATGVVLIWTVPTFGLRHHTGIAAAELRPGPVSSEKIRKGTVD